jgi:hypothetical protein
LEALRDTSHVRNHSLSGWLNLMKTAGFQVEESAELEEEAQMSLEDWMKKAGCVGEAAAQVRKMFADAPAEARRIFSIQAKADGDVGFRWLRVVLAARR